MYMPIGSGGSTIWHSRSYLSPPRWTVPQKTAMPSSGGRL